MKRFLRGALSLVFIIGVVVAVWPLGQTAYGWWSQRTLHTAWQQAARQPSLPKIPQRRQPDTRRSPRNPAMQRIAARPVASRPRTTKRWPLTRLVIPDIGVDVVVVQGWEEATLRSGPGHLPSSALPGERGNCVIAGHRNVYGSWFYRLDELWPDSVIRLETPRQTFTYKVVEVTTVSDMDMSVLRAPEGDD
ncbi:MAG: class D sortase, partial [Armatimonadota bacterium]|nr:class D sortase [Armatimonadota bacterium]